MKTTVWGKSVLVTLFAAGVCSAATLNVPGSFATIQAAVNAANNGDIIVVAAGSYSENVVITGKAITLRGPQTGVGACGRVASEAIVSASPVANPALRINGPIPGTLIIDGFTFRASTSLSGCVQLQTGAANGLQFINNRVREFTIAGVLINADASNAIINGNEIDGTSQTGGGDMFHIELSQFQGSQFTNNCLQNGFLGTGLSVDGNHDWSNQAPATQAPTIAGNTFKTCGTGVNLGRFAFANGDISANTFLNNTNDGLQGGIQGTTIRRNTFQGNGRSGLELTPNYADLTDATRGAKNNSVTQNVFTSNTTAAISLSELQSPGTISTNVIQNNSLGGTVSAIYRGAEIIDASQNWWGVNTTAGVVAKMTTSTNERQWVGIKPTATAGTFKLLFNGNPTSNIAFNAGTSAVQTALEAVTGGAGSVSVTGASSTTDTFRRYYVVEFTGVNANTNVSQLTKDETSLTGGGGSAIVITTLADGGHSPTVLDFTPWLHVSTDTDGVTAGFQGDFSFLHVDDDSPQVGATGRIAEAVGLLANGALTGGARIVNVLAGTYSGNADTTSKALTLQLGASPAQVTVNGNLAMNSDDTLPIELAGSNAATDYDNLVVNGTVSLGNAVLTVSRSFTPSSLQPVFTIISNDGVDPVVGTFASLPEGTIISISGLQFKISYVGGDGNDVTLTFQPGPGTLEWRFDKACYKPGETVTATLRMENLGSAVTGFQAFMNYDAAHLTFVNFAYTASPFGLPVINTVSGCGNPDTCVNPSAGVLNLAAGINQFGGQSPTQADADLATVTFTAGGSDICAATGKLTFRSHNPPTRITDLGGGDVTPLTTIDAPAITIDGTNPVVTPGSVANCYPTQAQAEAAAIAATTATDNCGPPVKTASTVGTCNATITVTATDCSGNFSSTQYSTHIDSVVPSITCPGAVTVQCAAAVPAAATDLASFLAQDNGSAASDNCGPPTVTFEGDVISNQTCANRYTITRTYRATDPCGLSSTCTQTITVNDNTSPVAVSSGPIATCYPNQAAAEAAALANSSATDNCVGTLTPTVLTVGTCSATITVKYTDPCGNISNTLTYNTRIDGAAPSITCPAAVTVQCTAAVPAAATNLASFLAQDSGAAVSDNCDPAPALSFQGDVISNQTCPNRYTITRTYRATDSCGNFAQCTQTINVNDTTPPSITCPANISVPSDAGNCTASAANVNPGTPIVSDNCDPNPTVVGIRSDNGAHSGTPQFGAPYQPGTTTIAWTVTDSCNNSNGCVQSIFVATTNQMNVSLELSPTINTGGSFPQTLTRCITFELWNCPAAAPAAIVTQNITFTRPNAGSPSRATNVPVLIPCGPYSCVTARDKLHTLRRTLGAADGFGPAGPFYAADFIAANKQLIGGNLNDDAFIDILDFGLFAGQFSKHYNGAGGVSNTTFGPDSGNTLCGDYTVHADISGDGLVFTADFTFIQINFLKFRDNNCCGAANIVAGGDLQPGLPIGDEVIGLETNGGPVTSITVAELNRRGLSELAAGDLNGDGVLDEADIAAFMQGARPGDPVAPPAPPTGKGSKARH